MTKTITAKTSTPTLKQPLKKAFVRKDLEVYQPKRCLIVEKLKTENGVSKILKGSHLNCGACGGHVGMVTGELTFPFTLNDLKSRLKYSRLLFTSRIVKCQKKKCNAILFNDLSQIDFVSFDNYKSLQLSAKKDQEKVAEAYIRTLKANRRKARREAFILKLYSFFKNPIRFIINLFRNK